MSTSGRLVLCVRIILERSGYQVLTALDGKSGLSLFESQPVEAVILDYALPGMHGGEVAALMRERKPQVPILLLSAYLGLPPEITGLVNVYMTKGEGAPALLEKLGSLFEN
jgi:DNA-binding response OmpR family regulator